MKVIDRQYNLPLQGERNTIFIEIELTNFEATFIKWLQLQPNSQFEYDSSNSGIFPFSIHDIDNIESNLVRYGILVSECTEYNMGGSYKILYRIKYKNEKEERSR